jgi:hypothetical protein
MQGSAGRAGKVPLTSGNPRSLELGLPTSSELSADNFWISEASTQRWPKTLVFVTFLPGRSPIFQVGGTSGYHSVCEPWTLKEVSTWNICGTGWSDEGSPAVRQKECAKGHKFHSFDEARIASWKPPSLTN